VKGPKKGNKLLTLSRWKVEGWQGSQTGRGRNDEGQEMQNIFLRRKQRDKLWLKQEALK
jgi:hypothetical protein